MLKNVHETQNNHFSDIHPLACAVGAERTFLCQTPVDEVTLYSQNMKSLEEFTLTR